ncbi:beta-ketoacyl synthase [Kalymmatonema gypsitolerans NIES-4073]|nr:beta-ketoacyl synthase [Scytonema sp. NIES-4073]
MTSRVSALPDISLNFSTLVDLVGYRAIHQPHQTAYTFLVDGETEQVSITYQDLEQRARAIAAHLQYLDVKGERALLLYQPGVEFIAAFLGCLYAGVIAVPVYPPRRNQRMTRLQAIAADSQAQLALTTTSVLTKIEQSFSEEPELASLRCIATDNIPNNLAQDWQNPRLCESILAFLQYTSGSTGVPKGVMVSHGNLLHNERMIQTAFGHTEKTIVLGWLPFHHDMGLIGNVLQPLYLGRPCILMSPMTFLEKPFRWLQAISRYKATTSGGPNFAYDLCIRRITPEQRETLDLSSWEVAFNGAEPIRAETLERFAATFAPCGFQPEAFYPCYGMAETTLIVSGGLKTAMPIFKTVQEEALGQNLVVAAKKGDTGTRTLVGCGKTLEEQQIVIANPDTLHRCTAGEVGEIWVSGKSVAQGYWNRSDQTMQTFHAYLADTGEGPFLRTGDLGFLEDGELFVTGRLKDIIIIWGRNYYPNDIELTVEKSHPALLPASGAAFVVEKDGEERVVVVQEVERQFLRRLDIDQVIGDIRQAVLQHHELLVHNVILVKTGSIPKTSSGKIQRYACRDAFLNGTLNVVSRQ